MQFNRDSELPILLHFMPGVQRHRTYCDRKIYFTRFWIQKNLSIIIGSSERIGRLEEPFGT